MKNQNRAFTRWIGVAVTAGAALILAGCGSSSSSSAASSSSGATASAVTIKTASGSHGTYLVSSSGRALYLWMGDKAGKSSCSGACAGAWPPLTVSGTPTGSGSVTAADLGTITRSDGTKQVTYKGHPLYYFAGDPGSGTTTGEGSDGFGAKWWLVAPSGAAITGGGSSSGSSSSSSSSSGGGY